MKDINIYYFTPFSIERNLGKECNKYVEQVKNDDDWICIMDADTMFLEPDYGKHIHDIVSVNQNVGLFTCYTNRVGNKEQCYEGFISENTSLTNHRTIAKYVKESYGNELKYIGNVISGYLMLFSKKTWKEVGKFNEDLDILGVDNDFSAKILKSGKRIALMKGIYLLHYYRLLEGVNFTKHLR